ncbi:MAG: tetratricopeptide repeat protein [Candidatus Eisenbacteria bacterium]
MSRLCFAGPAQAHEPDEVAIHDLTLQLRGMRAPAHALLLRAELHRASEQWAAAESDLADAAALDPTARELDLCRAVLAFERGHAAEAVPAFVRYLARAPEDGAAHAWFARTLLTLGRAREAAAQYDSALAHTTRITPELILARVALADSLEGPAVALGHLERGLARVGASAPLELRAADLEARLGRVEAALDRLTRLAREGGDAVTLGWRRGEVLAGAGRALDACVEWSEALQVLEQRFETGAQTGSEEQMRARLRAALDLHLIASTHAIQGGTP